MMFIHASLLPFTRYAWEEHPQREHSTTMSVGPFYMDRFPVTATNYSTYLRATGYVSPLYMSVHACPCVSM